MSDPTIPNEPVRSEPHEAPSGADTPASDPSSRPALAAPETASPSGERTPPFPQVVSELWEMIVAYLKQETLVPLAALRRYLAYGVGGALLIALAVIFVAMGLLRLLQTETGDTFTGNWDFVPYLIVFVVLVAGGAISAAVASGRSGK